MEFILPKNNNNGRVGHKMTPKEFEKHEAKERKRGLLYLMERYLRDAGLFAAADALTTEAQLAGGQYELCDNIDLDMILQDYSSYHFVRFDKYPKVLRRTTNQLPLPSSINSAKKRIAKVTSTSSPAMKPSEPDLHIGVTYLSSPTIALPEGDSEAKERTRPALCEFAGYTSEWREMADLIVGEIVTRKKGGWSECVALSAAVEALKEAVVYPRRHPQWFVGLLAPWKGILLYGPPGTGKTLLARTLAAECPDVTFINLTISTFVSKWRGESEKMLRVLFDVARLYAPTTIFIDELDALVSKHEDHQHDASRRFKSELLVQLDGLLSDEDANNRVFVLATTNAPWNLCGAILRRFEKRILVSVPDAEGRAALLRHYFGKYPPASRCFTGADFRTMGEWCVDFAGADIKLLCREVAMRALRERLQDASHKELRAPTMDDVREALEKMRPTSDEKTIRKYIDWEGLYGCT